MESLMCTCEDGCIVCCTERIYKFCSMSFRYLARLVCILTVSGNYRNMAYAASQ